MTRSVFVSFCVIALTIHSTVQLNCGHNEVSVDCPANCPYDHCPTYERQDRYCPQPEVCGEPECKCRFNTRRAENGTCISTYDCPGFHCTRPNEEYVACPSACPGEDCSQATPDGSCPYPVAILFVVECFPKCRCIRGYWRDNGNCVPYSECPQNKQH
ncbi:SCO-spondin-like [Anticarsia gemmatalis]|uniref:SCO-spondin-like n=1 Tax=Anticarsia gemmatalis TaxID=129554 RepID=UPI003F770BB6